LSWPGSQDCVLFRLTGKRGLASMNTFDFVLRQIENFLSASQPGDRFAWS